SRRRCAPHQEGQSVGHAGEIVSSPVQQPALLAVDLRIVILTGDRPEGRLADQKGCGSNAWNPCGASRGIFSMSSRASSVETIGPRCQVVVCRALHCDRLRLPRGQLVRPSPRGGKVWIEDPLRQWKLSPMDLEPYARWYAYSR